MVNINNFMAVIEYVITKKSQMLVIEWMLVGRALNTYYFPFMNMTSLKQLSSSSGKHSAAPWAGEAAVCRGSRAQALGGPRGRGGWWGRRKAHREGVQTQTQSDYIHTELIHVLHSRNEFNTAKQLYSIKKNPAHCLI